MLKLLVTYGSPQRGHTSYIYCYSKKHFLTYLSIHFINDIALESFQYIRHCDPYLASIMSF